MTWSRYMIISTLFFAKLFHFKYKSESIDDLPKSGNENESCKIHSKYFNGGLQILHHKGAWRNYPSVLGKEKMGYPEALKTAFFAQILTLSNKEPILQYKSLPWSAIRISKLDIEKKSNREKTYKDFGKPGCKRFLTEKAKTMLSLLFYILGGEKVVRWVPYVRLACCKPQEIWRPGKKKRLCFKLQK